MRTVDKQSHAAPAPATVPGREPGRWPRQASNGARRSGLPRHAEGTSPGTVAGAFRALAADLRQVGVATPELDARLLVCVACDLTHEAFVLNPARPLTGPEAARLGKLAARRADREPVSRLLGRREFWGREFAIGAPTLDPRPDSETLVAAALALVEESGGREAPLRVADLGTGSGCLLLTLLAELPHAEGLGLDVEEGALHIAASNADALGVRDRARFVCGSWLAAIGGVFDLVIANPPYVVSHEIDRLAPEVARFEPRLALDGGRDGLDAYRAIVAELPRVMASSGIAAMEVGEGQAEAVAGLIARSGLGRSRPVQAWPDLSGAGRCLSFGH